ncbi:MAG: O-antigen ligase family protein, partial [Candidatus Niameybacter stercoravium]|nr:O-antigen ligase family protein [Candidatus Niameybacter stercoravium]
FTQDKRFEPYMFHIREIGGANYLQMSYAGTSVCWFSVNEEGIHLVDQFTKEPMELEEPASIGFRGKERLGSARGYIWSRTLPLIKERPLLGYGPDAFAFAFPQNDLLGKWYAYRTPNMTVDKPHNLYLQIAVNQGLIALVAFLVLVGAYIINAIKVYAFRKDYSSKEIVGIAVFLSVIGYLGAGIFNDSIVSVAPIFWVLLGTGMGMNYIVQKEQKSVRQKIEHATINMKNRKHI